MNQNAQSDNFKISGTVVEAVYNKTIDYATVIVREKTTGDIISGTNTEEGGKFEITTTSDNDWDYKNIITWQLNDLPLTGKFIDFYKTIGNHAKRFTPWGGEENPNNVRPPGFNTKINREISKFEFSSTNCVIHKQKIPYYKIGLLFISKLGIL